MTFGSLAELKAALVAASVNAVAKVESEVYTTFAGNLNQYYGEFIPAEYIRTGALFGSLDRTGVKSTGSGASADVYFNTPSYQTGVVPLQSGRTGWATWSGEQVLDTAMHGSHGGYTSGTAIWDEPIAILNAEAINILKRELIAAGIPLS